MAKLDECKRLLVEAGHILEHLGHGDMTRGHVSSRLPGQPELFLMKPHSIGFGEMTEATVLTIDLDGSVVAGTARRHSEVFIHSEIYRARPDVHAVIHTHPTHTVAFSATGRELRPLSQGGAVFAGGLPVYTDTIDLVRTHETGRGLAQALGAHTAVLLRNHGIAMTGRSLAEAVVLCVMLEEAARIQLLVDAAGSEAPDFPAEDVARLRHNLMQPDQYEVNYAFLCRQLRATV